MASGQKMLPGYKAQVVKEWARTGFRRSLANYPHFVEARGGDMLVTEHDSHQLQFFNQFGDDSRFNSFGEQGTGKNQFINPGGIITTGIPGAQIAVADTGNKRVCFLGVSTTQNGYGKFGFMHTFGQQIFEEPLGLALDTVRKILFVVDHGKARVTMHEMARGEMLGACSAAAAMLSPVDIAIDSMSHAYVSDAGANRITVFDRNGDFLFHFGQGILSKPWGLCFDKESNLIVADETNNRILMFNRAGEFVREVVSAIKEPKGVSITVHDNVVVTTGDPYSFLNIIKFK